MTSHPARYFFISLLLAVLVLTAMIFLPFLTSIVMAGVLAVIFNPVYNWVSKTFLKDKERSNIASFVTVVLVVLIVVIPLIFIAGKIYTEVQNMYGYLTDESSRSQVVTVLNDASLRLSSLFFNAFQPYSFDSFNITTYLQQALEWAFSNLDTLFTSVSKVTMSIFIMFLALFYFLRDGREFKRQLTAISPLGDNDDEKIFRKVQKAIFSVVAGSLIVGVIQGILTGIGFAIFGVPSPALWGSIAAVCALIPGIGTSMVLVPGIAYLFFVGAKLPAVGLLLWSVLAVGLIDNMVGPILIKRGVKIHSFLILVSVLGGIAVFGLIGFILGPIILALLFALLEIYRTTFATSN